ncbi:hypothetical protein [Gloeothece verrucosa]|uniref:Uncharacterized protein n=1 Tax=Gloeothece verrucosa (strain PCC 7822) TaxID=497965 RepID=E0UNQ8_GLOV7|nr:hypothetical protein [Gloeothece verrucosa]ADN18588.1 hypothetical protein Cyan7822_6950 [Gloeothece verrucosa PCC 7822]
MEKPEIELTDSLLDRSIRPFNYDELPWYSQLLLRILFVMFMDQLAKNLEREIKNEKKKLKEPIRPTSINKKGLVILSQRNWILQALLISSLFIIPHGLTVLSPSTFKVYWKPNYKVWDWNIGDNKPSN